jgi:hypothetical protein
MLRAVDGALALLVGFACVSRGHAADFAIDLTARAGDTSRSATAVAPGAKPPARAVLTVNADTPITLRWTVRNIDKGATVKDVLVHTFVVKQERLDQPEVPKLNKGVAVQSALTMDFKPKARAESEVTFRVSAAGIYLIRLELKGAAGKGELLAFAALDLRVR